MRLSALALSLSLHAAVSMALAMRSPARSLIAPKRPIDFSVLEMPPKPEPLPEAVAVQPVAPRAQSVRAVARPALQASASTSAPVAAEPLALGMTLTHSTAGGLAIASGGATAAVGRPGGRAAAALPGCSEPPSKPRPLQRPIDIEYTAAARQKGVQGRLVLQAQIEADGTVGRVDVLSGVDAELDAAAVAAVRTWRFEPAKRCGTPVAGGMFTLARRFELGT